MGLVLLRNARFPWLGLQIDALFDPGVLHLCIPQRVCDRLQLERIGERRRLPYVGPLEVRIAGSAGFVGALVTGEKVVLGAIPLQTLELA